ADTPAPDGAPEMNVADNTAAEPAPAAETVTTDVADSPAPDGAPEMNAAKAPADTDDINARLAAAMEYEDDEAYGYYDIPSSPAPRTSEAETQAPVQEDAPLPFQPPQKKRASPDTTEPDGIRIEKPPVENAIPSPLHDLNAIMKGLSHPYKGMDPKDIKYPLEMFLDGKHVFTDFVTHLTMASQEASRDDRAVLAALLTAQSHCQLKGEIELTGSDEFKQRAITLIATYDLKLKLKNPEQVEMLNQARARLQSEPVPGAEAEPLSPDANHILWQERSANVASAPQQSALPLDILPTRMETALPRNASHKEASSGITGQLLAFGPAHYNFDRQKDRSYYAHLRTRHGERLVWGIGLQEAIRN
ncbi:LPD7 domain-containing protein, partial [Escherichia coli]